MACSTKSVSLGWSLYAAIATGEVFIPATGWMSATNVTAAKGWGELRGKTGNFQAKPAVQVANDVRSPGASTAVGGFVGGVGGVDGVSDPTGNVAVTAGTSKYIRAGWLVSLSSGTTLATGSLGGVVELIYG